MAVTNIDNQEVDLEKKIAKVFINSQPYLKEGLCPTKDILATALDKWSLFCLFNLGYYQKLRFTQLKNNIDGISSRMLSVTLKKLEKHQFIKRQVFAQVPPKVEYELTDFGKVLAEKMADLSNWFIANSATLPTIPKKG